MKPRGDARSHVANTQGRIVMAGNSTPTVVLVHGGFVDGAGWEGVYNILKKDGYNVSIVQNPTTLAGDVAATRRSSRRPRAKWCWWAIPTAASWSPRRATTRRWQSSSTSRRLRRTRASRFESLIANPPPGAPVPPILPPQDGYPVPRQGEVPRFVRGRRQRSKGCVHGRLPGAVGRRRSWPAR